jgi:hypothetical protein
MGRSRGIWSDAGWNIWYGYMGSRGRNIEFDTAGSQGMMLFIRIRLSVYRIPFAIRRSREIATGLMNLRSQCCMQ